MIAGTHSGVGKTTVATGIMAALARIGTTVASAKVGPDFIDPGYHSLATGRPGRNLDAWICGESAMAPLAALAGEGADLLVVEGVMGLFDGVSDPAAFEPADAVGIASTPDAVGIASTPDAVGIACTPDAVGIASTPDAVGIASTPDAVGIASTAAVANAIEAPVVLVVDASAMSGSVGALVHGFGTFSVTTELRGVILNRVGSESHLHSLKRALEPSNVPLLGALRRDEALRWRDRHLGLVPVVEHPDEVRRSLSRLADAIAASLDLSAIVAIARTAPVRRPAPLPIAGEQGRARIAVASGPAFSFMYPDNLERLEQAGADIVEFDPISDKQIPEHVGGLVAGGGFPETFAEALAANRPLLDDVRHKVSSGLPTWAECGGFLWLANGLDGHRLCGVVDAEGSMTTRLTLGYRLARARRDNPVVAAGEPVRGHEFHYSTICPEGDGLDLAGREGRSRRGYCTPRLFASYLHLHLGSDTAPAERFMALAARGEPRA